jgi:hypothetical protein
MRADLKQMKTDIRTEFEAVIDFVSNEQAQVATADQIERGLFTLLLSLGAKLLLLFFQMRTQACDREPITRADGQKLPYHGEQKRTYFSVFGLIPVWRFYFYKTGVGGETPLDADLSLGANRYSDLLRDLIEYLAVYVPSYGQGMEILGRIFNFQVSTRSVQKMVVEDGVDVEAYYEQKSSPDPSEEAEILVVQADGKGVPMVLEKAVKAKVRLGKGEKRGRKKEAIVTTIYTIDPASRTPEELVDNLFHPHKKLSKAKPKASPSPKPQNKHVWATLEGKDTALARLAKQAEARQGDHILHKIALTDGDPALQSRVETNFPDFKLILDFIHPNEYLWEVGTSLLGESNEQRTQWVAAQTLLMLSSQTEQVIVDLRRLAQTPGRTKTQQEKLLKTANYFERNLPYMDYKTYLANGWSIASGVIEGACRHFVKDRFELSGMRWTQKGAEQLLRLRAIAENGDWDAYHLYRQRQRHQRLYTRPFPNQERLEFQALELEVTPTHPQPKQNSSSSTTTNDLTISPVTATTTSGCSPEYFALPLAV